jgi:hypothetical protein
MSELKLTGIFAAVAIVLALLALLISPSRITPEAFMDQGELFFPDFRDPNEATSLEVIQFDEESGTARPFKVEFKNGLWTIPSHHDYPADGEERLAATAAGVIDIRKDDFRTDLVADHEACGVIDPLDEGAVGLSGRGSRITFRGEGGNVLAEFIVGKQVPDRAELRFVRLPDQNRVYASKMNLDISTSFADWIETNLLEVQQRKIDRILLDNYSINERTLSIEPGEVIDLRKGDNGWGTRSLGGAELDTADVRQLTKALEELSIVGVRPKPEGLSASLKDVSTVTMTQQDRFSLQNKGFYIARQDGRLLSNEGDMKVYTEDGVVYTLRFGEVLHGTGMAVTAGLSDDEEQSVRQEQAANRYLFVTAEFLEGYLEEPPKPASMDFETKADSLFTDFDRECQRQQREYSRWERLVRMGREQAERLNARFADWYYVIAEDSFKKIHLGKNDLKKS